MIIYHCNIWDGLYRIVDPWNKIYDFFFSISAITHILCVYRWISGLNFFSSDYCSCSFAYSSTMFVPLPYHSGYSAFLHWLGLLRWESFKAYKPISLYHYIQIIIQHTIALLKTARAGQISCKKHHRYCVYLISLSSKKSRFLESLSCLPEVIASFLNAFKIYFNNLF